jgi:hypothetical protein
MALELRLAIEARLGQELPLLSVGGGATLSAIATRIVKTAEASEGRDDTADRMARHEAGSSQPAAEAGAGA